MRAISNVNPSLPAPVTMAVEADMTEAGIDFLGALSSAYRRATRAGLSVVGTDLVLYCALARTSALGEDVPGSRVPA